MSDQRTTKRAYQKRPPILNNRDAERAKPSDKPYQRKVPEAPGAVLRIEPNGTKTWKLIHQRKTRRLGAMPVMTYAMAVDKALRILRGDDPDKESEPTPEPYARLTFGKFLDEHYQPYLEQHHSRPAESLSYLRAFKLDDKPLTEIRLADVETFRLKRLKSGRAKTTVNREVAAFKAALQRAVDWDLLETNPLAKLKPLKTDKRGVVRYLSDDEATSLQAALKARDDRKRAERDSANEWRAHRLKRALENGRDDAHRYEPLPRLGTYADNLTPMITLALNTGLRRGELWNLKWGDIDMRTAMLTVHGSGAKSGQTRHIPLNAAALACLKTHRGDVVPMPSKPVFGRHEFKKAFSGVLKAAQIESFRFHDLRHTFASRLVMAGVPLNTVRELMGHASLDMTLIYAHLAPDNLRHAVDLIGGEG